MASKNFFKTSQTAGFIRNRRLEGRSQYLASRPYLSQRRISFVSVVFICECNYSCNAFSLLWWPLGGRAWDLSRITRPPSPPINARACRWFLSGLLWPTQGGYLWLVDIIPQVIYWHSMTFTDIYWHLLTFTDILASTKMPLARGFYRKKS